MSSAHLTELVERYQNALQRLDMLTDRLSDEEKRRYIKLKSRFEAQMAAWQSISMFETNQIKSNLQESYNEIESIWYSAHRSSSTY